jgi:hypothetical protein
MEDEFAELLAGHIGEQGDALLAELVNRARRDLIAEASGHPTAYDIDELLDGTAETVLVAALMRAAFVIAAASFGTVDGGVA